MSERCAACPGVHCNIPPDGPQTPGGLLFIGEAPGGDEEKQAKKAIQLGMGQGRPFVGKTGQEVDLHYLPYAGLKRKEICLTNAIRCFPTTSRGKLSATRAKDLELLDTCATHHLYPLIERMQPRLIIPLGAFACRAVCPDVDLEIDHGRPTETPWGIPAFPMYHPALGIHEPKKMLYIRTDWHRLRKYLSGTLTIPSDPYAGREDYREVQDVAEIADINPDQPWGGDTEYTRTRAAFCLTYSQRAGTGRLIRAERHDLLAALSGRMQGHRAPILFHNWLADYAPCQQMGISFPSDRLVDTMAEVFRLGNLPQGLKALSQRELGMEMQDFLDVVGPHSREQVLNYYRLAALHEWPRPEEQLVDDGAGGLKLYRPQSMNTKLKRFFTDLSKDATKDVFEIWSKWDRAMLEAEIGEWPGLCISHVPFTQVLHYACRDSDALIRLYPVIKAMQRRVRKYSQEHWRAA